MFQIIIAIFRAVAVTAATRPFSKKYGTIEKVVILHWEISQSNSLVTKQQYLKKTTQLRLPILFASLHTT